MIVVACVEAVALVAVVFLMLKAAADERDAHAEAQQQWAEERRELVTRIQAPERVPVPAATEFVIPESKPDEWATAGQIEFDPEYGLSDDG